MLDDAPTAAPRAARAASGAGRRTGDAAPASEARRVAAPHGVRSATSHRVARGPDEERDADLLRSVLHGGIPGEHAALELLRRRRAECWEDAVALLGPGTPPRHALAALEQGWRAYRREQRGGRR